IIRDLLVDPVPVIFQLRIDARGINAADKHAAVDYVTPQQQAHQAGSPALKLITQGYEARTKSGVRQPKSVVAIQMIVALDPVAERRKAVAQPAGIEKRDAGLFVRAFPGRRAIEERRPLVNPQDRGLENQDPVGHEQVAEDLEGLKGIAKVIQDAWEIDDVEAAKAVRG